MGVKNESPFYRPGSRDPPKSSLEITHPFAPLNVLPLVQLLITNHNDKLH